MSTQPNMTSQNDLKEELCGCTDDCGICCYGCWCAPCLFGSNAEKINDDNCVLMCLLYSVLVHCSACWVPHFFERRKLRKKYNLKENDCGDLGVTICCGPCALCQEAREIKSKEEQKGGVVKPNRNEPVVVQPQGVSQPQVQSNPYEQQQAVDMKF